MVFLGVAQLMLFEMICHGTAFGIIAVMPMVNISELASANISWCLWGVLCC